MVPHQGGLFDRAVAVLTVGYSTVFGDASLAQAAGIVLPILFLFYRWYKVDRPRAVLLERMAADSRPATSDLDTLRKSSTAPGEL